MDFEWIHESAPLWDGERDRIIGGAADGIFALHNYQVGGVIPGDWWRVAEGGATLGYGWMDANWGDAEILLAVAPEARGRGVGGFILDHLEREAAQRGLNYMYNVVAPTHPEREQVTSWLEGRGFVRAHDGETLRRRVRG